MSTLSYILQVNFYLILFYGLYQFSLKKETFFAINRFYLLSSVVISLIIPFVGLSLPSQELIQQSLNITINDISQRVDPIKATDVDFKNITSAVYFTGVALSAIIFLYKVIRLNKTIRKMAPNKAFSFFRIKIIDSSTINYNVIDSHEQTHVRQLHSVDVLFFELLVILCWFNPVIYCYKISIKRVHEYLADRVAANYMGDKKEYAMFLLNKALGFSPALSNSFADKSLIESRVYMLYREKSTGQALLKYVLIMPLLAGAVLFSSASHTKTKFAERRGFVNVAPLYPGGLKKFTEYLSKSIKGSKAFVKSKDKVQISFIIDTDGSITEATITKGGSREQNDEAIRIIENCPRWRPGFKNGEPVKVQFKINLAYKASKA